MGLIRSHLRRVVARAGRERKVALGSALSRSLAALDWRAPNLPDEAVVCIRSLRLPADRLAISFAGDSRAQTRNQATAWAQLAEAARNAARPADGFVPVAANAVRFADEAELLACLAADWCAGEAALRWWWSALFPRTDPASVLREKLRENPRLLPSVLARVGSSQRGAQVLSLFPAGELDRLWTEIARAFDLAPLAHAWTEAHDESSAGETAPSAPGKRTDDASAPWLAWTEVDPNLPDPVLRLLVVAQMLHHSPVTVRSAPFARAVQRWRRRENPRAGATERPEMNAERARSVSSHRDSSSSNRPLRPPESATSHSVPPENRSSASKPARSSPLASALENAPGAVAARSEFPRGTPDLIVRENSHPSSDSFVTEAATVPPLDSPLTVTTDLGGVFYLANVALALGYYGDFTMPSEPGLALPVWDFLALVGARFIGPSFATDPLAGLLAELSGRRAGEPPGHCFEPGEGKSLDAWLDETESAVAARLAAAFGKRSREEWATLIFAHTATVRTSRTRVDVTFALNDHPIELRLAGLDRDPGWLPAGGRILAFHYD